jgi:hypothetical protein
MAADPQPPDTHSNDLFGRWLAHHEQQSADQGETTEGEDSPEATHAARVSRRLPTAAIASSAVTGDPMIGSRIVPPSAFGVRRPAANAPQPVGPVNELDREPPPGWEPIVMRSVRKKVEQAEAKQTPKPVERRSRLQRLKARLVDPPPSEPETEIPLVPLTPPVARAVPPPTPAPPLPTRTPAPHPPAARSLEETILAAVPHVTRPAAKHVEPRVDEPVEHPVPVVRHKESEQVTAPPLVRAFIDASPLSTEPAPTAVEPEPVVIEPEPYVEPEPVAVEPEPEPYVRPTPVAVAVAVEPEPAAVEPEPVAVEPEPEPVAVEPEPVVVQPVVVQSEPYVEPARHVEPEPELVVAESVVVEAEPEPAGLAEPDLTPIMEPEPVLATVTEIEPDPVEAVEAVEPPEPTEPPEQPAARRSFLTLPKRQPREPKPPREPHEPRNPARAHTGDAARDLVAASKARARASSPAALAVPTVQPAVQPSVQPAAQPAVQPAAVAVETSPEPAVAVVPTKESSHDETAAEMPGLYRFTPRRTARRLLTIAMLIGLVVSAYFVRAAIEIKDSPSIGLAAIVVLATATVWAIRAGASVTTLEVHQGQLVVVQQGARFVFDLSSKYTLIEVHGEPGRRGWRVLFPRRGMAPFAIDATMVDADDFMRVLRFFRPQLVSH